jgi:flavin reductase (DIM6/NTAB) family NADH-FMN oxidoreductase RutF
MKNKNEDSVGTPASTRRTEWQTSPELPQDVFAVLRKPERALNPVAVVATVDPDGTPHTAPFGSIRAITSRLLRLVSFRYHETYTNFSDNGKVMIAFVAPPDIAVSIRGKARVVREQMRTDEHYAIVEVTIEEVKNDMVQAVTIESGITISAREERKWWFDSILGELEEMG